MTPEYIEDQTFTSENYSNKDFPPMEYEHCVFANCSFAGANLKGSSFSECEFLQCDLSNTGLEGTIFREAKFRNCKMLGLRFDQCDPFLLSVNFEDCLLSFSSFFSMKLKGVRFIGCRCDQADFTKADLTSANFSKADLSGAIFKETILEKADLQTAVNFSIDPDINRIRKAKFSTENVTGLLDKYDLRIT